MKLAYAFTFKVNFGELEITLVLSALQGSMHGLLIFVLQILGLLPISMEQRFNLLNHHVPVLICSLLNI